ncbi:endonuclease 4 [uncultured archaeon]|nr:endonuclease 4 [uncultured archaeon]
MVEIRFGPSGIGGKSEAITNLGLYSKMGLRACEVAFTYGVYFDKVTAEEVGKKAKDLDIKLSIHAPYYVNLNSDEKAKIEATKKRILDCCEIGHYFSCGDSKRKTSIVFHPGYYSEDRKKALENIEKRISELMEIVKEKKWNVILCPELMGKINVFGSIDEIAEVVNRTGCSCCIDFAHVLARYQGEDKFEEILDAFSKLKEWHCHFSGIIYTNKGEKQHRHVEEREWKHLLNFLKKLDKQQIIIICEAPDPVADSEEGLKILEKL